MTWLVLLLASVCSAESAKPLEVSGYLKELWQYSASPFDTRPYFLNTDRARLTLDGKAGPLKAHVDYDNEVLAGSYFRTTEYKAFGFTGQGGYLGLDHTVSTGTTNLYRMRLYRGWVGLDHDDTTVRFGRQRIAWGTGKLWNPTDVLNPYQPLSIERDERGGVDAGYIRQGLGTLSQAELAYAFQDTWIASSLLGRAKGHWGEFDGSLMGGKVAASTHSWMVGGDLAGNLWDGTVHGEWSYTALQTRTPYWKADIGYEYTFPTETKAWVLRDAAVVAEYYHSGSGVTGTGKYNFGRLLSGQEVTLAQDYAGLTYSKDLHPLLKLELALITNCDDGSQYFSPVLTYNALKDLYLTGGFQRFGGPKRTEFGRPANLGFLQAQYYF